MKFITNTLYYLIVAAIACVGLLLVTTLLPIPGNFKVKVVKSGSMEPAIRTGGIVVIRPASSYEMGDIVTFGPDTKTQVPTTHRVVAISGEGAARIYTTKGDANDAEDLPISEGDVIGRAVYMGTSPVRIPYLGIVAKMFGPRLRNFETSL